MTSPSGSSRKQRSSADVKAINCPKCGAPAKVGNSVIRIAGAKITGKKKHHANARIDGN